MPGEALRETMRVQSSRVPLLPRHLDRLRAGGCDAETLQRAMREVSAAAHSWDEEYGRLTLDVSEDSHISVAITRRPSSLAVDGGPSAVPIRTQVPRLPPGAAKPADRSFWDAALRTARERGGDIALLVDDEGRVMDGSQASVFVVYRRILATPPSPPALAGVARGVILDMAHEWGYTVQIRAIYEHEIDAADEVLLTSALAGAVGASGRAGSVANDLAHRFEVIFGKPSPLSNRGGARP